MEFLGFVDWIFVIIYLLVIAGISIWSIRKSKESASDYFLANRNLGWFVIGASILASNVGSEHIVGLAGSAAKSGTVLGHYELHSYIVLILGWVFVPFYMRSMVYTMPEFLERRFNPQSRRLLSIIQLLSYVITKASVTIFAGALVFNQFLGVDFWTGAIILVVVTGVYTIFGGLHAVMYTEAIQAIVLLIGSLVLMIFGLREVGGWDAMIAALPKEKLNMFPPMNDPEYPWLGILIASPIVGLWYWCTDQHIVQRCLAARNEQQARRGTIFAAYLKLMPFFIFLIPGLIAYVLHSQGKLQLDDTNAAFPAMVKHIMPVGLRGLLAGGLLAALMSSLASVYNACSTLYTMDIYQKQHPEASEKQLVKVGRIATGVVVILGMLWIPLMGRISSGLYDYLQSVQSYLAPPIAAVFLLGVFFKRLNAKGAYTAMVVGFIIGLAKLTLQMFQTELTPGGLLHSFATINFLYFCIYLFLFSIAVMVVVSLLTPKPDEAHIRGLTFATTVAEDKAASRASWNKWDVILSLIVVVIIVGIFVYFSPLGIAK
ncbi:sodium:solute symporter [Pseudobacter ginsenosidimutans]|jgi:SSS family solute:Na+ symporter|uniref:SSS family solute:Na+ symporter n=1 Tax=Pseudobacter ginsenosidimutans TaxID=661488 RepID=A0A4Q7MUV5_9BACT|nr:sodium:solute symporter [Pseudobacter ginsenosidimutans]QEC40598.1 sodium/solute symporter [Pseudobacter ginsenosidimutans]RZS72685.1 SSS family solute:Na+ symporter [Pseudobacter ginsenosidimutans]